MSTPTERFEQKFALVLDAAWALADEVSTIIDEEPLDAVRGDAFPQSTALRMLVGASPLYLAGVTCLRHAESTLGAFALCRPLVEYWSHAWHVMNAGANAEREAVRVQIGWARADRDGLLGSPLAAPGELDKARRDVAYLESIMTERRWKVSSRDRSHVTATLKEMQRALNFDWVVGMYEGSSRVLHANGHQWRMVDSGGGTSALTDAPPSERAARLNHLVILWHSFSSSALVLMGMPGDSPRQLAYRETVNAIIGSSWLARVLDGDYD